MNRTIPALPLFLLLAGCRLCADLPPFVQTAALAGDAAGLRKFEGRWFDEEGNLIAVISSPPEPRLSIQTFKELEPKEARLQNGEIVFRLGSHDDVFLRLTGKDKMQVSMAGGEPAPLSTGSCSCTPDPLPVLVLVRRSSPAWLVKLTSRKTKEEAAQLAHVAYEGAWDWLARTL